MVYVSVLFIFIIVSYLTGVFSAKLMYKKKKVETKKPMPKSFSKKRI